MVVAFLVDFGASTYNEIGLLCRVPTIRLLDSEQNMVCDIAQIFITVCKLVFPGLLLGMDCEFGLIANLVLLQIGT
jgi:hypothetical protein